MPPLRPNERLSTMLGRFLGRCISYKSRLVSGPPGPKIWDSLCDVQPAVLDTGVIRFSPLLVQTWVLLEAVMPRQV